MSARIVEFGPEHLPGVMRLWERMYERPRTIDFYRWSLVGPSAHRALLVRLAAHRLVAVRARATCPVLAAALGGLRFLRDGFPPVFVWPAGDAPPPLPMHLTLSAQDGPMLPYRGRWPFGARPAPSPALAGSLDGPAARGTP